MSNDKLPVRTGRSTRSLLLVWSVGQLRDRFGQFRCHADVYEVETGRCWRQGNPEPDTVAGTVQVAGGSGAVSVGWLDGIGPLVRVLRLLRGV